MNEGMSDIDVALAAAAAGAAAVRATYGTDVTRHPKSGLDYTTDTDLDAERAILEVIAQARPEDSRVGEESGETRGRRNRRWLVDPLCGTLNFAAQTPLVAVNVALLDGPATLACVSADPIAGETFWSDGNRAALRRSGADQVLRPSPASRRAS